MKKITLLGIVLINFLVAGCTFSFEKPEKSVTPVQNLHSLKSLCVYQSLDTTFSYADAGKYIASKLDTLNITYKMTTKEERSNCDYFMAYYVSRSFNVPTYINKAAFLVTDINGYTIGSAQYFFNDKSNNILTLSSTSLKNDKQVIDDLLYELFNQGEKE